MQKRHQILEKVENYFVIIFFSLITILSILILVTKMSVLE
jgi:cell division protein FtsL